MIAHGFVVVGLFFISTSFLDEIRNELSLKWAVQQSPILLMFLLLVLASSCSSTTFNFVEVTYLIQPSSNNVWFFLEE
jgi:hypothetical protein